MKWGAGDSLRCGMPSALLAAWSALACAPKAPEPLPCPVSPLVREVAGCWRLVRDSVSGQRKDDPFTIYLDTLPSRYGRNPLVMRAVDVKRGVELTWQASDAHKVVSVSTIAASRTIWVFVELAADSLRGRAQALHDMGPTRVDLGAWVAERVTCPER